MYELAALVRRYPLAEINPTSYIIEAVAEYIKDCGPDAKREIALRILKVLRDVGIDPKSIVLIDIHGLPRDVTEVIEMLGIPTKRRYFIPAKDFVSRDETQFFAGGLESPPPPAGER